MQTRPDFERRGSNPFLVAIGVSGAKGLRDIQDLLAALPRTLPAVVLVVLHRPSDRISALRDILARASDMPVFVTDDDDTLRGSHCYVESPDAHLSLAARSRIELVEGVGHKHRNRTVDILFNSVAQHAQARGIGVVLSGALDDGSRGLAAIHHAGGATMVLTHEGVVEGGMPSNAPRYDGPIDLMGSANSRAK
jgi:two-component system, chemotaxis family, protein-glutamate methylesterase/glutaminase